ncbi:SMI1/KNR4 family protein [Massilia sp. CCM 9210]|uniref:SMI1/KNR4 family protein n=1 Tax=Massilia scottii TaxID=3057166 RepID=UPI0027965B1F|nr:SMI1/KNR4 family protein [Massilia sp. CCM 9210]MDQ1815610.1 SMI1/KNR4 family protein [Massilia sp. CCM 9210]
MSDSFDALAASTGIALPPALRALIESGRASRDDPDQMALLAMYDFHWLSAQRAGEVIGEWLNPVKQKGNVFLPFARSGAGDAYCLVRLYSGEEGVCMVWHDSGASHLHFSTFDRFVAGQYVAAFANLTELDEEAGDDPEGYVRADVARVIDLLEPALQDLLRACLAKPLMERPYKLGYRARPEMVLSWISQDEEEALWAQVGNADPVSFDVVARWEE